MCGRYGFTEDSEYLIERFGLEGFEVDLAPNYNTAPSQIMPIIFQVQDHNEAEMAKWGLIPSWAKEVKITPINAKAESVAESAMFKFPLKKRRCLIPANFFFEWKVTPDGKVPHLIKLKDGQLFTFAGLYDVNDKVDPEGKPITTFTIITTEPNELMQSIHNRMPVILSKADEKEWLNSAIDDTEYLKSFLKPFNAELMEAFPVSHLVNSPKNNFPEIMKPIAAS